MLKLTKNNGAVQSFASDSELFGHIMTMENERLLGCDLYLMLEKNLPGSGVPPDRIPAVVKSGNEAYSLVVNTRQGMRLIPDPAAIGIDVETLDALFEENLSEGKAFLYWDSPILEAIKSKGGHNQFWGDNIKCPWSFLILTPKRIARILDELIKAYDPLMLHEAWEKQLTLVEACRGNLANLKRTGVASGAEVEALRKEWILDYCKSHGMVLEETE